MPWSVPISNSINPCSGESNSVSRLGNPCALWDEWKLQFAPVLVVFFVASVLASRADNQEMKSTGDGAVSEVYNTELLLGHLSKSSSLERHCRPASEIDGTSKFFSRLFSAACKRDVSSLDTIISPFQYFSVKVSVTVLCRGL